MNISDKVIEKIQKLLALAADPSNEHEAAAAAAKAQELLFEHNLTMAQVSGHKKSKYVKGTVKIGTTAEMITWQRLLFQTICDINFCRSVSIHGTLDEVIIGKKHNCDVVMCLYHYLNETIKKLGLNHARNEVHLYKLRTGITKNIQQFRNDFCFGASVAVRQRLKEKFEENQARGNDCRALVVTSDKELDAEMKKVMPDTFDAKIESKRMSTSFVCGLMAGEEISINEALQEKPTGSVLGR